MNVTSTRSERFALGLLLAIFIWFTWRGLTMFYSGDDMMNMYRAWDMSVWRLIRAQLIISDPVYRPVGDAVYRLFYYLFGFHPRPLYIFCWTLLLANVVVCYWFFRLVTRTAAEGLTALSLVLVHGSYSDLYYSTGTIYDRLCFLFTLAGLIAYIGFRRRGGWRLFAAVCVPAILAMGSKESGAAFLPVVCCLEAIYFLPGELRSGSIRSWLRTTAPVLAALAALTLVFVWGRVKRTPELATNPGYIPDTGTRTWLNHVAEYLRILTYRHVTVTMTTACVVLLVMAALAIGLRSRAMMFGWLFFVISITPVALIASRPGYVLYLPALGLGLFFAALIMWLTSPLARHFPGAPIAVFLVATLAITWLHLRNWPAPWDISLSPEFRLTRQFRSDYPSLPANSKLLFVSDDFPIVAYDLLFNLRLLYGTKAIQAYRLSALPDQKPDPIHPPVYDHIFASEGGHYVELDLRNPAESIRLNILRGVAVGSQMDVARPDHSAYVVYGLKDVGGSPPSMWTDPQAEFKFRLSDGPKIFAAKFWVPDVVAAPPARMLSILVNGAEIGRVSLTTAGMHDVSLPVTVNTPPDDGYTLLQMNVDNPYKGADGVRYGVILVRAGFKISR